MIGSAFALTAPCTGFRQAIHAKDQSHHVSKYRPFNLLLARQAVEAASCNLSISSTNKSRNCHWPYRDIADSISRSHACQSSLCSLTNTYLLLGWRMVAIRRGLLVGRCCCWRCIGIKWCAIGLCWSRRSSIPCMKIPAWEVAFPKQLGLYIPHQWSCLQPFSVFKAGLNATGILLNINRCGWSGHLKPYGMVCLSLLKFDRTESVS